ncbi:MAG: hypothetical protein ACI841_002085 [Planctomycetota bacterium]|jgi:hypothetical protein
MGSALVAAIAMPALGTAQSPPSTGTFTLVDEPADIVEDIFDEYAEANTAYREAYSAAETDEEKAKARETRPNPEDYGTRLLAIVEANSDKAFAFEAIQWILNNNAAGEQLDQIHTTVLAHHVNKDGTGDICAGLSRELKPSAAKFLKDVIEFSSNESVRGKATYALAGIVGNNLKIQGRLAGGDEETLDSYKGYYGEEAIANVLQVNAAVAQSRREALLAEVAQKYADVKTRRGTLGEAAEADLFELRNLVIGKVAPNITGEDLDGVEFNLSDYRGKVVFLDFWGDW